MCDLPSLKPLRIPRNVPGISSTAQTFGLPVQNLRTAALAEKACGNVFDLQIHQDTVATCPVSGRFLANCPIEASIKLKSVESVESCIKLHLKISFSSVDFLPFHLPSAPFRFGSGVACCKEPCGYNASSARGLAATTLSRWGDSLGVDPLAQEW